MVKGWREVSIGDVTEMVGGGTPSTADLANFDGGIPWLTPRDLSGVHDRYMAGGARTISRLGLERSSAKLIPAGSVLLTTRAPIGYVAMAKNSIATNQGFRSLVPCEELAPEFLYYWLLINTSELERHASGSTFKELSGRALARITLPLPPKWEQRRIVATLGSLDDKIELNHRMAMTLDEAVKTLFRSWFVEFDPVRAKIKDARITVLPKHIRSLFPAKLVKDRAKAVPWGWSVKALDEIAHFRNGLALQKYRPRNGERSLPVLKIAQLRSEKIGEERASSNIHSDFIVEDGDLVFSWSASLMAKIWCGGRAALNQHLFKVTSIGNHPEWFIFHWLHEHMTEFRSIASDKATTMGHIKRTHLSDALCVVPSDRVMRAADEICGAMHRRCIAAKSELRRLARLRNVLLPRLISGEVRIPKAEKLAENAT